MTTAVAEAHYRARHLHEMEGRGGAIFNPLGKTIGELPVIYGLNNGGNSGWYEAVLVAEDGNGLGSHICSHESYMPHDLGILEGTRPDRHEGFRKHYPDGYRMEFVPTEAIKEHRELQVVFAKVEKLYQEKQARDKAEAGSHV